MFPALILGIAPVQADIVVTNMCFNGNFDVSGSLLDNGG